MTTDFFDQRLHKFVCENPKCGKVFEEVIRRLLKANEVVCPHCGVSIDIRESKGSGAVGKAIDTADQMNKRRQEQ